MSFEWHDFHCAEALDWSKSFHPGSVEICLNLQGRGRFFYEGQTVDYEPLTAGFYCQGAASLQAKRLPQERHQFITVELSRTFLSRQLSGREESLHPFVRSVMRGDQAASGVTPAAQLTSRRQQLVQSLRRPPVSEMAQSLWYQGKALELMAEFFIQPPEKEFFCLRQQRLAHERVERVLALLQENLAEPPSLEEISRQVGCSQFYLSRTFSAEMDQTIPQYLRQIRLQRAAELLKSGKYNVTEAALEVGYNSLSHFSQAFHQTFGCCPGLYPLATPSQQVARITRGGDPRQLTTAIDS